MVVAVLNIPDTYMMLPYDTAGSRSKNRFRVELLWGISKILDLMEQSDDFIMVFDHVCDIEVHKENKFDFYQIKSKSSGKTHTAKNLTKRKKEGSIIGKLYVLATKIPRENVMLAIVTNAPYKAFPASLLENSFASLPEKEKDFITAALKLELNINDVDLSNVFYIQTYMDLEHPEDAIRGKLIKAFATIKKCEPINPNALYRLIADTVSEKACYEYSSNDYSEILRLKGLSRKEFDELLNQHAIDSKTGFQTANKYVDSLKSVKDRRTYKLALPNAVKLLATSKPIKNIEIKIAKYLFESEVGDTEQAIDLLISQFDSEFPIEINQAERVIIYLIILGRFEDGVYDHENGL